MGWCLASLMVHTHVRDFLGKASDHEDVCKVIPMLEAEEQVRPSKPLFPLRVRVCCCCALKR